jgi:hypothetical protein
LRFRVTPGQSNDITVAPDLLDGLRVQAIHADKACDGNDLRIRIAAMKAIAVPPPKTAAASSSSRTTPASTSIATESSDASDGSDISRRFATP